MERTIENFIKFLEEETSPRKTLRANLSLKAQRDDSLGIPQVVAALLKYQLAVGVEFPPALVDECAGSDLALQDFFPKLLALPQVDPEKIGAFIETKSLDLARLRVLADEDKHYPLTPDFEKVLLVLRDSNITFKEVKEDQNQMVVFTLTCKNGKHTCLLRVNQEKKWFSLHLKGEFAIPADKIINVSIFFSKLNATFLCGSFILDPENGDFSYKYAFNTLNNNLSPDLIRLVIGLSFETFDSVFPEITKLANPTAPSPTPLDTPKPN